MAISRAPNKSVNQQTCASATPDSAGTLSTITFAGTMIETDTDQTVSRFSFFAWLPQNLLPLMLCEGLHVHCCFTPLSGFLRPWQLGRRMKLLMGAKPFPTARHEHNNLPYASAFTYPNKPQSRCITLCNCGAEFDGWDMFTGRLTKLGKPSGHRWWLKSLEPTGASTYP